MIQNFKLNSYLATIWLIFASTFPFFTANICGATSTIPRDARASVSATPIAFDDQHAYTPPLLSPPLPASQFVGKLYRSPCKYKKYFLKARWDPSSSADIAFYQIIKQGWVIEQVAAGPRLVFKTYVDSQKSSEKYQVVAVSFDNLKSIAVPIKIKK